nr:MAG TPA: hypothetical protein [Caudoviricetes sp.]
MHFFFLFNVILCFLIRYKGIGFLLRDGDKRIEGPAMESLGTGRAGCYFEIRGFGGCPNHLGAIS